MDNYLTLTGTLSAGALIGIGIMVAVGKIVLPEPDQGVNGMLRRFQRLEWLGMALVLIQVASILIDLMARHLDRQLHP